MINLQPAICCAKWRRAAADAAHVPNVGASKKLLMVAPVQQVRRRREPHFRLREWRCRIWAVQCAVMFRDLLRKQQHVFVLRRKDETVPAKALEVLRGCQGG